MSYEFRYSYDVVQTFHGTADEATVRAALAEVTEANHWADTCELRADAALTALDQGDVTAMDSDIVAQALAAYGATAGDSASPAETSEADNYVLTGTSWTGNAHLAMFTAAGEKLVALGMHPTDAQELLIQVWEERQRRDAAEVSRDVLKVSDPLGGPVAVVTAHSDGTLTVHRPGSAVGDEL